MSMVFKFLASRSLARRRRRVIEDVLMVKEVEEFLTQHGAWNNDIREAYQTWVTELMSRAADLGIVKLAMTIYQDRFDPLDSTRGM